jgi:predicted PurR-regulated permease PerM
MEAKRIQTWFFGALFLLLFLAVGRILTPFFTVLLWTSLLYVLFSPLYHRIVKHINLNTLTGKILQNLLAGAFSIGSVIVIVVPLGFVAIQLARQTASLIKAALAFLEANPRFFEIEFGGASQLLKEISFGAIDLSALDIKSTLSDMLSGGASTMLSFSTRIARNVGAFIVGLAFMIFSLFFFYIDGAYLLGLFVKAVPIRKDYMAELVAKFRDITRNLFLGYILVSMVQGLVAYLIFLLFGVEGALTFAILLIICSFIPMIGAGTIWGPIGVFRIFTGDVAGGMLFLVVSGIFISTLDNFLRPFFLKDRIKLHPLVIFFSILGGVTVFGFNGLIVGPMVVILFLTVLDLFLSEHDIHYER